MTSGRPPRHAIRRMLHPLAWWGWAGVLAMVTLRTTNVLLLGLIGGVVIYVVGARRSDAPWARAFGGFIRLGVVVIVIRMAFQVLFGNRIPGTTLFTLPSVELPNWAAGVSIGGPVTFEGLVVAFQQGLRLAVLIICFGAATSLTSPYRLMRTMPAALYEAGVALTVALSFAPQALVSATRIREAQRLRGRPTRGIRSWAGLALPVLEGALDRSVALAASMDSRGYGRRVEVSSAARRITTTCTVGGLLAIAVGTYALLDGSAPDAMGLPVLAIGSLAVAAALVVGGRRTQRTRYRPDAWLLAEWLTVSSGLVALVLVVVAGRLGAPLHPSVYPLDPPTLPWLAALGVLVAAAPAFVTPRPPGVESSPRHAPVPEPREQRPSAPIVAPLETVP